MEDRDIVTLYWQRDEEAIRQTDRQYGRYLSAIAFHILADREDSRETVNDTYLRAWGSMPPHRPRVLSTYLGHITRHMLGLFQGIPGARQWRRYLSENAHKAGADINVLEHALKLVADKR